MNKIIKIVTALILVILLAISCVNPRFVDGENIVFEGKTLWTENEIQACEIALSNLEADSIKIIFRKTNMSGQGQAQPLLSTILRKPNRRTYLIKVQDCNNRNPLSRIIHGISFV